MASPTETPGTDVTATENTDYFEKRSLKKGAVGWFLLASLGVSYVISGDFSGWNLGLAHGGFFGLAIAFIAMGIMYACMVQGLAEMSSALPTAGAGYGFARRALGKAGGFATGMAILIEYTCAPAAISVFIAGYIEALGLFPNVSPVVIIVVFFVIFIALHIIGVGEALKIMLAITAVALVALAVFAFGMVPHFDVSNLFNIAPDASVGGTALLPYGISGILSTLPFGIWFFLAVEGVPLAAEEAANPRKDVPRGILVGLSVLVVTDLTVLLLAPGGAGAALMSTSSAPLVDALNAVGEGGLATFVNFAGLAGLIASFFSIIYASSRQMFALSRAGYLPRWLSVTGSRKTPARALIILGAIGFLLAAILQDGDTLIDIAVFGACVSYALMNLSHIVLRKREPDLPRAYRTPGGVVTTGIALVLSCVAIVSTFFVDVVAALCALGVFAVAMAYFFLYARHHLVANAPEEEFAQIVAAQSELR